VELRSSLKPRIDVWASGRKDNIRALLATLHSVLWEGSGWVTPNMADMVDNQKVGAGALGGGLGQVGPCCAASRGLGLKWLGCRGLACRRRSQPLHTSTTTINNDPACLLPACPQVKRVYMKANLVVHPDKVKQKGGTLEQVATADMVFDVLKGAWGKFEAANR
jgi:hypothetical protein